MSIWYLQDIEFKNIFMIINKMADRNKTENIDNYKSNEYKSNDKELKAVNNFTRSDVEGLAPLVNLVDSDENKLDMFCYVKCCSEDSEILKKCRGVVFNESKLILKAFPYTTEYNNKEITKIDYIFRDFKDWVFFESHEGSLVRVFYFNKWYISTHRKLDAFRSKWASKESFGTYFKNALISEEENNSDFKISLPEGTDILDRFQTTLDKTKQYMFLIRNSNENRIVSDSPDRPTVYHVGTFVNGELNLTENINIPCPKRLIFDNVDSLLNHMKDVFYRQIQGVIGFDLKNNKQVKIVHQDYQDLFNARGNEPSIKFRYLQVRLNKKNVDMLYHLYPEMTNVFDDYENMIYKIGENIYKAYVQRFIKKQYVIVDKEEFNVVKECHSWYLSDRNNHRVSLNKVISLLNQQNPTSLNRMIHRIILLNTNPSQSNVNPVRLIKNTLNNSNVNQK